MSDYIERDKIFSVWRSIPAPASVTSLAAAISQTPSADVAPVRHGRWIEDERTYPGPGLKNNLCSACGEVAGAWKEGLEPGRKWDYCPNCGAKMDRKEDEHETD